MVNVNNILYFLDSFEKLKHFVNNIGNSGTKKAPS